MKMLSFEEARGQFAKLAEEAKRGEEILLTENGAVVMRMVPERREAVVQPDPADVKALLDDMEEGMTVGPRDWKRDDLYEERLKRIS